MNEQEPINRYGAPPVPNQAMAGVRINGGGKDPRPFVKPAAGKTLE